MGRRRRQAPLYEQTADGASYDSRAPRLSTREYYNQRYDNVDKNRGSTTTYADDTKSAVARMERLWRE